MTAKSIELGKRTNKGWIGMVNIITIQRNGATITLQRQFTNTTIAITTMYLVT